MTYYKIIRDGEIIGAGCNFMKWFPRTRRFAICDMQVAECAHDVVSEKLYHADWLKNVPQDATMQPEEAIITIISAAEYDDLIEQLIDGETIPVDPEPEPEPAPEPEPVPEPEHRMTVQEMRDVITQMLVDLNGANMTAHENYAKDVYFSVGIKLFQALEPIVAGEQIEPGKNCREISAAETLNKLNESEE